VGTIQSVFLGIDFLFLFNKKNASSRLIGGLFLVVGIRVLKSTLYLFTEDVHLILINLGFAAHYLIGPLLFLYIISLKPNFKWNQWNLLHIIPGLLIFLLAPWLTLSDFWYLGGYSLLLYQSLAYLITGMYIHIRNKEYITHAQFKWGLILSIGLFIFLFTYFSNYELRLNPYHYAPLVYAGVVYAISFYLIKNRSLIFSRDGKYRNVNIDTEQAKNYQLKINKHYKSQRPYLNNNYSLGRLSNEIKIPKHLLSLIFSSQFKMSFIDYTNRYRIEEAKFLLKENPNFTISSVAFDCGFNSLSSFNQAFKKFAHSTPSKFRDSLQIN
jgi:AraC-like DNA-binding protein